MSRLIVKNLPAYLTQERLREHFESKDGPGGTLTDVKVLQKPDGTSRRFGFVGYKTDAEAEKARKWFDRTFVHSSRISVTVVDGAKDAPTPRPNKRPRLDRHPTEHADSQKAPVSATEKQQDTKSDPQLEEYLEVMQPRAKKGPSWKDGAPEAQTTPSTVSTKSVELPEDPAEALPEPASDADWLKRHMRSSLDTVASSQSAVFDQVEDTMVVDQPEPPTATAPSQADDNVTMILQTGRLFLRNLAFSCTEEEIQSLFESFGTVAQAHIPLDPVSKSSKGMAYVTFSDPSNAVAAYRSLDKKSFQGRLLHILPAVDRKGKVSVEDGSGKPKTVKEEKDAKRKSMAGKEFNWAMLYMNSDAVLSSVADRMNLSKSDILNPDTENAAVKLALAETHVIQETKAFLETNGVVLTSLSGPRVARSDSILLVKNIPYGTSADQIRELFEPHGQLQRVLVPPAGTMAVVEFVHADEGRKAFRAVAYRRMGNSVIYLEKGPIGMFAEGSTTKTPEEPITVGGAEPVTIADAAEPEQAMSGGATLFVKNLSFSTTSERFTQAFHNLPDFSFARVQTKPDPKRPGAENARLSMGYGFIGFKTPDAAKKAIKSLQGHVLDGHALVVKFAARGADEDDGKSGATSKNHSTKMIVKNVPFEATKKDIRELFGSHGQLKSVRLPKKFDHRSRGFAFLEFVTRHEAENAYAALKHTHLLGRHLVLEWVDDDSAVDIDELRKKAGVGFGGGKEMPGRKRKLDLGDNGAMDLDDL
ncbi:RNA-binding domain-containing protein [Trametopsis cervina]|nr:RNA-binding domain-containing protein [Trametopsis cervina]